MVRARIFFSRDVCDSLSSIVPMNSLSPLRWVVRCASKHRPSLVTLLQSHPTADRRNSTMANNPNTPTLVEYKGSQYQVVKEGLAQILNPPSQDAASKGPRRDLKEEDPSQSVFYNPIQQFNRDLSVLAIRAYGEHLIDLKKQKADRKLKKQAGNGEKKRKREDDQSENPRPAPKADERQESDPAAVLPEQPAQSEKPVVPAPPPPQFSILDALSATGLRALRYASEIPFATKVVGNDLSESAIKSMKNNIEYNNIKTIQPNLGDARVYMYENAGQFDVIDLDPYGTASPFIDAAIQAAKDGGLLCVTCTDAGVWASTGYSEKAFSLYGGIPLKGFHSHESGLRLILNSLVMSASRYGIAVEPLLSLSIDFYARVFVRVHKSPAQVKFNAGNTMIVYSCDAGCGAWTTQYIGRTTTRKDKRGNPIYHHGIVKGPTAAPKCEHCGMKTHIAGPMWGGPLHNPQFIQKILALLPGADPETYGTCARLEGMLTTALEEDLDLTAASEASKPEQSSETAETTNQENTEYPAIIPRMDVALKEKHPFYFSLSALAKVLHSTTVPIDDFRGALSNLGYRSTRSHTKPNTVRSDAPWSVIWEIMREWVRQKSPIKESALTPGSAAAVIMSKSRENSKSQDKDQSLSLLKQDLLSAVETGADVTDLVTKIEAALYRSKSRTPQVAQAPDPADPTQKPQPLDLSTLDVVFDADKGRAVSAAHSKKRLVRYQMNPRANWGPLNRARRS